MLKPEDARIVALPTDDAARTISLARASWRAPRRRRRRGTEFWAETTRENAAKEKCARTVYNVTRERGRPRTRLQSELALSFVRGMSAASVAAQGFDGSTDLLTILPVLSATLARALAQPRDSEPGAAAARAAACAALESVLATVGAAAAARAAVDGAGACSCIEPLLARDAGYGTQPLELVAACLTPRELQRLAATCHETWFVVPPGLSAADAARVRVGHSIWPRIVNRTHRDWSKETRLHWAARQGRLSRVRELCDWRAELDAANALGVRPLFFASQGGHLDVVRELLDRGASVDAATASGDTSLLAASRQGHLDVVRALLARGASVDAATASGWTSLHAASQNGHHGVVRALLNANAGVCGATSLYVASAGGHLAVVRELLAAGASVDAMMYGDGPTSLCIASQEGRLDVVRELLANGADVEVAVLDGRTPLILASSKGHHDVVSALLAAGANQLRATVDGETAATVAGTAEGAHPLARSFVLARLAAAQ